MGLVKDATGNFSDALLLMALLDVVAAVIVLTISPNQKPRLANHLSPSVEGEE